MLKNAPLSAKLLLILIFPLLGLLFFAGGNVVDKYHTLTTMNQTVEATTTAQRFSNLITSLQRERGASGVFLGSGGKSMQDKLVTYRQETDAAVQAVRQGSAPADADLTEAYRALDGLASLRSQVDGQAINNTESGTRFTGLIKALIGFTHSLETGVENSTILRAMGTLNQFIEMKERAGRERVLLGLAFSQNRFDAGLLSRFASNLGEFSAYLDTSQRRATAQVRAELEAVLQQPDSQEVARLQQLAYTTPLGDPLNVKPEAWFTLATTRIDQIGKVEVNQSESVRQLALHTRDAAAHSLWLTLGAVLIVLGVVLALSFIIIREINRAVGGINGALVALSRRDLTAHVQYQGRDEFGQIASNLNNMAVQIRQVIQEIGNATSQVATAAEEASAVAVQTSQNVAQQRTGTDQVATAINQMSATVRDVARSTTEASEMSQQANANTAQGRSEIERSVQLVQALSEQAEQTATIIDELKRESDSISSVVDVIRGVAEQTNLLALNAAIEAARAGEQGRGFAVVADEVRHLAQKTQESTVSIQAMIGKLQDGSDRAASSMQETLDKAKTGASNVERAGQRLVEIAEGIATISDRNIQVASAAEEQTLVAEEISRNVNDINDLVIQVSAGAEQTAATSRELARLAEQQQALVGRFKV